MIHIRFKTLKWVNMKVTAVWDATPCSQINVNISEKYSSSTFRLGEMFFKKDRFPLNVFSFSRSGVTVRVAIFKQYLR